MNPPVRIVVSQQFDTSAEAIFDAWLDPSRIGCWFTGANPSEERIVRLGVEPRIGGKFSFVLERRGKEIEFAGKYLELDRPNLLVFTWSTRDSLSVTGRVIVEIFPIAQGCELTLTHVLSPNQADDGNPIIRSWRARLAAMAATFTETKTLTANPA